MRKKKSCSTLCQEFVSVFAKNWAQSSGLSLCRQTAASQTEVHTQMPANMASTSCLWLNTRLRFCPPKQNKKHKMASRTSAILELLNKVKVYLSVFFSWPCCDGESILCQALRWSQQTQMAQSITGTERNSYISYQTAAKFTEKRIRASPCSCDFIINHFVPVKSPKLQHSRWTIFRIPSAFINFSLTDAYPHTTTSWGIKVGIGQQVNMAETEGLMSARLNARPGPRIDREEVKEVRYLHKLAYSHNPWGSG